MQIVKRKAVLKGGKYGKIIQSQRRKLLVKEDAVSILVKGCNKGNITGHKEGNVFSGRVNFHFGLSDPSMETTS